MNKNLYSLAIFFNALQFVVALVHSIIYFQLGARMYTLESYVGWFLVVSFISLAASLFLLKYYHVKKYRFTFLAATIFTISALGVSVILYKIFSARELENLYSPAALVTLAAGILYGVSLLFSNAGKMPWLRTAGVLILLVEVVFMAAIVWTMTSKTFETYVMTEKIAQWTSLGGSLIPLSFVMNFVSEWRIFKAERTNTTVELSLHGLMTFTGVVALLSLLIYAQKLSTESYWLRHWLHRGTARAQELAEPFEASMFINSEGDTLKYRLMKPLDYDPQKKYPLAVCLHGGAGWGTDNVLQVEGSQTALWLSEEGNRRKYPAFIFVPQCAPGTSWGGLPVHRSVDSLVFETIAGLEKEFPIDTTRRYVMGESLGGYGSWYFIGTRPGMFAAAIPICGEGNPAFAKNAIDVAVWAFHGRKDINVPVRGSQNMVEAIRKAGGNPRYTEFPDAGHNIWLKVRETPGLLEWLFEQKQDQ